MEANAAEAAGDGEVEEDFVLLDLGAVQYRGVVNIPPNAPYILSIGQYEEGNVLFSVIKKPSEENLFSSRGRIVDPSYQAWGKEVKPVASVTKIVKFRLLPPSDRC